MVDGLEIVVIELGFHTVSGLRGMGVLGHCLVFGSGYRFWDGEECIISVCIARRWLGFGRSC
jgi:hypothetical protein